MTSFNFKRRMILERDVSIIIMLADIYEGSKNVIKKVLAKQIIVVFGFLKRDL